MGQFAKLGAKMPFYRGYIVGLHDRPIGVVPVDHVDDESAIKSAARLVVLITMWSYGSWTGP